ncbi:MAG: condensation domain-containing protein [Gordonia sp. (in: high G+C Gram-positive bacteria)]|uniref:condensation domain-containing protein n=1 Tax=Gordonia sp. (in: high G+C Gram-positive bacteria) TaxID=84139 RepID=UPI0039E31703
MDFLQILDLPLEPGGLVEWTPVLSGTAALTEDPRSTSYNHEQHLHDALAYQRETGHTGGRESWLGVSIDFDEPLSIPAIRTALTAWIDRHEVLRSHVVADDPIDDRRFRRLTVDPGAVKLKMSRIGWYHDSALLIDQVAGWFDRSTAPVRWPAYRFATVGREASFTLLFAGDHSLLDGYSLVSAVPELRALYRSAVVAAGRRAHGAPSRPLLPDDAVGSYVDYSAAERHTADDADDSHPAVQAWAAFLAEGMPRYPTLPAAVPASLPEHAHGFAVGGYEEGAPADARPQESYYALLADDATTGEFTAVCSGAGTTLFAGVMAALAHASADRTGTTRFRAVLPRHTRHEPQWQASLGWFVSLSPFELDLVGATTFTQLAVRASAELRRARVAASLPLLRVAEILGTTDAPQFVVSFLDTRSAPDAAAEDAGRSRVVRSHRYADDEVYLWINRTPAGLRLSARFPAELGDDVRAYADAIAAVIADVAEHSSAHLQGLV